MTDESTNPTMPERPPLAALRAIEQKVEIYRAIRDALQEPHEYPPEPRTSGDGRPPNQ